MIVGSADRFLIGRLFEDRRAGVSIISVESAFILVLPSTCLLFARVSSVASNVRHDGWIHSSFRVLPYSRRRPGHDLRRTLSIERRDRTRCMLYPVSGGEHLRVRLRYTAATIYQTISPSRVCITRDSTALHRRDITRTVITTHGES